MRRLVAFVFLLLVVGFARLAAACSCSPTIYTFPVDGATDVPVDSLIVVWGSEPSELRANDEPVSFEVRSLWQFWPTRATRVVAALTPATSYSLAVGDQVIRFSTGTSTSAPPVSIDDPVLQASVAPIDIDSSCPNSWDHLALTLSEDPPLLSLSFFRFEDLLIPREMLAELRAPTNICRLSLGLDQMAELCVEVRAVSASGVRGEPATVCAPVTHCASVSLEATDPGLACAAAGEPASCGCRVGGSSRWPSLGPLGVALALLLLRRRHNRHPAQ
jgi:hypothetical protein